MPMLNLVKKAKVVKICLCNSVQIVLSSIVFSKKCMKERKNNETCWDFLPK